MKLYFIGLSFMFVAVITLMSLELSLPLMFGSACLYLSGTLMGAGHD